MAGGFHALGDGEERKDVAIGAMRAEDKMHDGKGIIAPAAFRPPASGRSRMRRAEAPPHVVL
jgi:hypothetical protein